MDYMKAVSMQQEMAASLEYKDIYPEMLMETARKYAWYQWVECAETLLAKLRDDQKTVLEYLRLVQMARNLC